MNEIGLECNYLRSIILFDLIMCNEKLYNYILIYTLYLYECFGPLCIECDTRYIVKSCPRKNYILYRFIYLYLVFLESEC
jgi:hypothetical protein